MSGKTLAAAIALFTTPIVARLFDPGDFGVAAVFVSVVSIVSNISSLRFELTFSLPKKDLEGRTLVILAYRIMYVVCLALLASVAANWFFGIGIPPFELLGVWAWLLPFGLFVVSSLQLQESWLTRKKLFKLSSFSLVLGNITTSGSRILFGILGGTTVYGLIIGHLLGICLRLFVQRSSTREFREHRIKPSRAELWQLARRYSDFPIWNAPAGLIFSLGGNLPVLLFGTMFSPAAAGLYAMAHRLSHVPVTIVASSMRRVFLQKAASIRNQGRGLMKAYAFATGGLALLGVLPLVVLTLFGQPLLGWLLGDRWLEAGRYLEIIAPWMFMIWVTAPANPVFVVLRQQKFWLGLQLVLTILRLGAFALSYALSAGPEWTLQAFVAATVIGNLLTISITIMVIAKEASKLKRMQGGT